MTPEQVKECLQALNKAKQSTKPQDSMDADEAILKLGEAVLNSLFSIDSNLQELVMEVANWRRNT